MKDIIRHLSPIKQCPNKVYFGSDIVGGFLGFCFWGDEQYNMWCCIIWCIICDGVKYNMLMSLWRTIMLEHLHNISNRILSNTVRKAVLPFPFYRRGTGLRGVKELHPCPSSGSYTDMCICVYFIDNSYLLQLSKRISSFHFKKYKYMGQVILIKSHYPNCFLSGGKS